MLVQVAGKDSNTFVDALIRQVGQLPKSVMASLTWDRGTDLSSFSQDDLDQVALKLNIRSRKTLGYATLSDRSDGALALTT